MGEPCHDGLRGLPLRRLPMEAGDEDEPPRRARLTGCASKRPLVRVQDRPLDGAAHDPDDAPRARTAVDVEGDRLARPKIRFVVGHVAVHDDGPAVRRAQPAAAEQ